MITIELTDVRVEGIEGRAPDGERVAVLVYTDQTTGIKIVIPHNPTAARVVAAHLEGRPAIHVANGIPPHP
jgi:hypothetical protein